MEEEEYVRLRYIGKFPAEVDAITTIDGKPHKPVKLMVEFYDIFLCTKADAKKYKQREFEGNMNSDGDFPIYYGITKKDNIKNLDKLSYNIKWEKFEKKKGILLHYLCDRKSEYLFGLNGRSFCLDFNNIFSWILGFHQEYKSETDDMPLDFNDILEALQKEGMIICHEMKNRITGNKSLKITLFDGFFDLLEIIEAKKNYENKKAESLERQNKEIVKYGDICFNLNDRSLEIGTLKGDKKLRNIDKTPEELRHLKKNVTTSIMLLYCIVRNADENNEIELKRTFNKYDKYAREYKTQTGFKPTGSLSDFKTYVSKLRQILDDTGSRYEITKGKKQSICLREEKKK